MYYTEVFNFFTLEISTRNVMLRLVVKLSIFRISNDPVA